jgi:hypothetical protein
MPLTLDTYRPLDRSGLRVSPLALGTATFGTEWGWGAEEHEARRPPASDTNSSAALPQELRSSQVPPMWRHAIGHSE